MSDPTPDPYPPVEQRRDKAEDEVDWRAFAWRGRWLRAQGRIDASEGDTP